MTLPTRLLLLPLAALLALHVHANESTPRPPIRAPGAWEIWGTGWVRLESDGHLSCLSLNGRECVWNEDVPDPATLDPSTIQPLVCGRSLLQGSHGVGYHDGARPWCRSAYASLYADWQDYTALGVNTPLAETPEGDLMCYSKDGVNCLELRAESIQRGQSVKPLVCGAHHRATRGESGYDQPRHWCRSPKIVKQQQWDDPPFNSWQAVLDVPPWTAAEEPALVAQVDLSGGRAMALEARMDGSGPEGFTIGTDQPWQDQSRIRMPWPDFRPTGVVTAAMAVTAQGRLCFLASESARGPFFASATHRGNTTRSPSDQAHTITRSKDYPPQHGRKEPFSSALATAVGESIGSNLGLKRFMFVIAREVPVEGSVNGARRKISYAQGCDSIK